MTGIRSAAAILLLLTLAAAVRPARAQQSSDDYAAIQPQFEAGNYSAAIETLRALISQNPKDAAAYYWLGRCYYEMKDYGGSVTALEKSTSLAGNVSVYHQWLGRAYGEKADQSKSFLLARHVKQEFETAIQLDPSNISARRDLEDYLLEAPWIVGGSKEDALKQVEAIAKIDAVDGHLARADYDSHLGKNDDAAAAYKAALDAKPQKLSQYFQIADYYAKRKDGADVQLVIQAASAVDPKDPRFTFYQAEADVLKGSDLSLAEQDLKSYLASTPDRTDWPSHSAARYWLGQLYEQEGKTMEAAEQYRAALRLDPGRKDAKQALQNIEKSIH